MRITIANRGPEPAPLRVLPTVWFRNTWSWQGDGRRGRRCRGARHPVRLRQRDPRPTRRRYGSRWLYFDRIGGDIRGAAVHRERDEHAAPLRHRRSASTRRTASTTTSCTGARRGQSGAGIGTKAAAHYALIVPAGGRATVRAAVLAARSGALRRRPASPFADVRRASSTERRTEADEFYAHGDSRPAVGRRARRDAAEPGRPALVEAVLSLRRQGLARRRLRRSRRRRRERVIGRNHEWTHLYNADVISMPDKWEYPWYAAWDLAFHCVPLALVDRRLREGAARADAARVVHAPERAASGLRMGVRRRQSAGARVGGAGASTRSRRSAAAPATASSSSGSSRSCCSTSPGGSTARTPRAATSSRAASSASTTSASSIDRRRCRPAASSSSPTARAGWRCTR